MVDTPQKDAIQIEAPQHTDAFIVGGGPAGLAAAIALRMRGIAVTLADPARPPIDKTCGEGLMPDTLEALTRLGVQLPAEHSYAFRGIRFLGDGASVDASFPHGQGLGIRRTHLHQALIDRAEQLGATLLWGTTVKGLSVDRVLLGNHDGGECEMQCRWMIGADGENSRVRRWAALDKPRSASKRYGFRRHFAVEPWTDCVEIYWGPGCQLYVTPIAAREMCVVLMSRDPHLRLEHVQHLFPELFDKLENAEPTTSERGAVSATRRLVDVSRGNVFLVGDASGSVDAITGEGLRLGFAQALALAKALEQGSTQSYSAAHRRLARRPAFMARLMLLLDHSPWLRERALHAFAADPTIFARQLAMHVGASTVAEFVCGSMLPLGRRILRA
jgi:menaquinone-9 beta-reductase